MKANHYTLLDVQKAIVLAQRNPMNCADSIRITSRMRSMLLQQAADLYTAKHGDESVCYAHAAAVMRKAVTGFAAGCGVSDSQYIGVLTAIFVDQLKAGVPTYGEIIHPWI